MKIIITCVILLFCLSSNAQGHKFIGWSKSGIDSMMINGNLILRDSKEVANSTISHTDTYQFNNSYHTFIFFYNFKGTCFIVNEVMENSKLTFAIADLNENFRKTGDDDWITKGNDISIHLSISEKYFKIIYRKI